MHLLIDTSFELNNARTVVSIYSRKEQEQFIELLFKYISGISFAGDSQHSIYSVRFIKRNLHIGIYWR